MMWPAVFMTNMGKTANSRKEAFGGVIFGTLLVLGVVGIVVGILVSFDRMINISFTSSTAMWASCCCS